MKSFFNHAVIGNSRVLATLNKKSQFLRVFWPNVDNAQHIDKMQLGIYFPGMSDTMHWIESDDWHYLQYYVDDTNILKTVITSSTYNIKITMTDLVTIDKDIITRNIEFENISAQPINLNFGLYCSGIFNKLDMQSSIFDFDSDSIVFYKHNNYMFISADKDCKQFQLTNNPFEACSRLFLYGVEDYSLSAEGAAIWEIGELKPNDKLDLNLYIAFGHDINITRKQIKAIKKVSYNNLFNNVKKYWLDFLKSTRQVNTGIFDLDSLYKRSILTIKLMCDENTGGIVATPEIDEEMAKTGRYGYCWPRDATFITTALDRVNLTNLSKEFYEWTFRTQDDSGMWHQRYYVDGSIAPSWGIQIDETGSVIWGIWHHYCITKDKAFLKKAWESVFKACEYLVSSIDKESGLQKHSYDIWENNIGQHCYTAAAVYAGLMSGCDIGNELGKNKEIIDKWAIQAQNIKSAISEKLWDESIGRFRKAINIKLNPWGEEPGDISTIIVNKKGYWRTFTSKADAVDASIIGLSIPFNVFDHDDVKIKNTVQAIEEKLTCQPSGGIRRYEDDPYMGGQNPWVITTLWLAMYYIRVKKYQEAKSLLFWVSNRRTKLGFLPEQIDNNTGEPAWVFPLIWSHAMFIHTLLDLKESGII